jgi:hypothetical protein
MTITDTQTRVCDVWFGEDALRVRLGMSTRLHLPTQFSPNCRARQPDAKKMSLTRQTIAVRHTKLKYGAHVADF